MDKLKTGDYVRLEKVTDEDITLGRFVGEIGIYQGEASGYDEPCVYVRFGNHSEYVVYSHDISLEKPADIDSLFRAYTEDYDGYEELRDAIKNLYISTE